MFFERRSFLLICITLAIIARSNGQNDEDSASESVDNENNLVLTYKTPIERLFQSLANAFDSISAKYSAADGNSFGDIFNTILPKSIQDVLEPVKNQTIQGFGDFLNRFKDRFHAIYPGTVWCGQGNAASSENDVGYFAATDSCCRNHDKCPHYILAGQTLGPLFNDGCFPRFACLCDLEFYNCLKNESNPISRSIGTTYFNYLRPQCFAPDNPSKRCARQTRDGQLEEKCPLYDAAGSSQNKTLKWFDNPSF